MFNKFLSIISSEMKRNISIDKIIRENYHSVKIDSKTFMMTKDIRAIIIINIIISFYIGGRGAV